jgi:hypothetical protein
MRPGSSYQQVWTHRSMTEFILGINPQWDALVWQGSGMSGLVSGYDPRL